VPPPGHFTRTLSYRVDGLNWSLLRAGIMWPELSDAVSVLFDNLVRDKSTLSTPCMPTAEMELLHGDSPPRTGEDRPNSRWIS